MFWDFEQLALCMYYLFQSFQVCKLETQYLHFYRWGNGGPEISNLLIATQLLDGGLGFEPQQAWSTLSLVASFPRQGAGGGAGFLLNSRFYQFPPVLCSDL